MGFSPPGSSVHGIFQVRILEWVYHFPGDLPDPGIEPKVLHCSQILYHLSHWGSQFFGQVCQEAKECGIHNYISKEHCPPFS